MRKERGGEKKRKRTILEKNVKCHCHDEKQLDNTSLIFIIGFHDCLSTKKTFCQSILRTSNLHRIVLTRRERKGKQTQLSYNYLSHFDICYWLEYNLSSNVSCLKVNKTIIWFNKCIQYIKSKLDKVDKFNIIFPMSI